MLQIQKPPKGFELVDRHTIPSLFNPDKGIIITIHETDDRYLGSRLKPEKWKYKVIAAKNQETKYKGSFQSLSHAKEKQYQLANEIE